MSTAHFADIILVSQVCAREVMSTQEDYYNQFYFRRRESQQAAERYLTGLLTDHPNKSCDTLA